MLNLQHDIYFHFINKFFEQRPIALCSLWSPFSLLFPCHLLPLLIALWGTPEYPLSPWASPLADPCFFYSKGQPEADVLTVPPVVAVRFAATTRGGLIKCCPWSAASMAVYHCQVAAVTLPASTPFPVGGSLCSSKQVITYFTAKLKESVHHFREHMLVHGLNTWLW